MKRIMTMAVLAVMLTTSAAFAAKGEWIGGGQGGVHMPSGDYGDVANSGYVGGVFLDYGLTPMFTLGANFDFNSTSAKDDALKGLSGISDIQFSLFNYGVNGALNFMPEGALHPYVKVGAGMYGIKTEYSGSSAPSDDNENKFGFSGGAGLMFRPAGNAIGFGVEGLIHSVPDATKDITGATKDAQFFNITGRISFSFSDASQQ